MNWRLLCRENVSRSSQMEKELQWIRRGGKKMGNKARMKNYEELKEKSVFEARVDDNLRKGKLVIPPGPKLGNKVVKLVNVSKSFNARRLIKDLTLTLEPGSVVGRCCSHSAEQVRCRLVCWLLLQALLEAMESASRHCCA